MPTLRSLVRWGIGLLLAAGCGGASHEFIDPPDSNPWVQLINVSPGHSSLDLLVGGQVVASSVPFGGASALISVPSGVQVLTLQAGGQAVGQMTTTLAPLAAYAAVAGASGLVVAPSRAVATGADTATVASATRGNLRFVNIPGTGTVDPAVVSILLSAPATVDTVARFGLDTRIASRGPLMLLDPGSVTARVVPDGGQTVLLEITLSLGPGETKAIVLERDAAGALVGHVVVEQ
jgi:Domain of unknown function (DUF4397)